MDNPDDFANAMVEARLLELQRRDLNLQAFRYLSATLAVHTTDMTLPPMRAAIAGLPAAWRNLSSVLEMRGRSRGMGHQDHDLPVYEPTTAIKAAMKLLTEAIRLHAPLHYATKGLESVYGPAVLAGAACLYLARRHAVIEPSVRLQEWLSHTDVEENMPVSQIRLPLPALFLEFGPVMRREVDDSLWSDRVHKQITRGVYIFESSGAGLAGSPRTLTFVAVGESDECPWDTPKLLQWVLTDETASSSIQRALDVHTGSCLRESEIALVHLCAKVLLYLQANRIDALANDNVDLPRRGARQRARSDRQIASRDSRIVVGPQETDQSHLESAAEGGPRRGVLRMQMDRDSSGPEAVHFIAPACIRPRQLA